MGDVVLEYDPADEQLALKGLSNSQRRHPVLATFLRQFSASTDPDGTVVVATPPGELSSRYNTLVKLLSQLGASASAGAHASVLLSDVERERLEFLRFSQEADRIWNGDVDVEAFSDFVSKVERLCHNRKFYRKQLLSAFHMAFAQHSCNFSVPGAGKTSIVYACYAYLRSLKADDDKRVSRLLIVGPLSSFKAWEDEYAAIFGNHAKSKRLSGIVPSAERKAYLTGIHPDSRTTELTLTSYSTLANSEEDFRTFLGMASQRTMIVLDEAHYIKGEDGIRAASTLRLAPLAAARVVLTGTPAPNGYEDLSNLFRFIYPARNVIGFSNPSLRSMTDGSLSQAIPQLQERIRPFFTRIRKSDLHLPPASQVRVPVEMGPTQERIYRGLERQIIPALRQVLNGSPSTVRVRARLIRLRQACCNPELLLRPIEDDRLFDDGDTGSFSVAELEIADLISGFNAELDLERMVACKSIVKEVLDTQGKILVWSYFLGNLDLLKKSLGELAPFVEVLSGATPVSSQGIEDDDNQDWGTREQIIDEFHRVTTHGILIANPQAVGESISLHKACQSAVYFDRDFNAGRFIQSKDRIHRYNPAGGDPVTYYYLQSPGTVDIDIDSRLALKEDRLAKLVDANDIPLLTSKFDGENLQDIRAILDAYEHRKTE